VTASLRRVWCTDPCKIFIAIAQGETSRHWRDFYGVQGTEGWVFDKRLATKQGVEYAYMLLGESKIHYMLLDESKIQTGLFVFEPVDSNKVFIRSRPDAGDDSRTAIYLQHGHLVAADVILQSPFSHGNGSSLLLVHGSGWLLENKHGERLMRPVFIREGEWTLKILNMPFGIGLRRQPIDNQKIWRYKYITYKPGKIIQCSTHMVHNSSGIKLYHVKGTGL
jgi:hypothetical protein